MLSFQNTRFEIFFLAFFSWLKLVISVTPGVDSVIIGNGQVVMGVDCFGQLNVEYEGGILGLPAVDPLGIGHIGIRNGEDFRPGEYVAGQLASTEPGCLCEGWGVSMNELVTGYADNSASPATTNLDLFTFTSPDTSSAVSVVDHTSGAFRVTHDFHTLSDNECLIEVTVTIENLSGAAATDVKYVRKMDWDISPTEFSEFVTISGSSVTSLFRSHDNGFSTPDPLAALTTTAILVGTLDVDFEDSGPSDHGAYFAFNFGDLANGQSTTFNIYYGVAPTEVDALQCIDTSNIEVYSLGQSNTADGPTLGTPATFIFGFNGVDCPPFEPCTDASGICECDPVSTNEFQGSIANDYECLNCQVAFGESCLQCENYHGCVHCDNGYELFYNPLCGLYECVPESCGNVLPDQCDDISADLSYYLDENKCPIKCDTNPCNCQEDNCFCRICHSNGCNECQSGYFKKGYDYPCVSCEDTFGAGCLFCQDFNGCGQCAEGYERTYNVNGCHLWSCVEQA